MYKVPNASIEPITSKRAMKIFDEYANILKGIRFNGRSDQGGTPASPALGPTPPLTKLTLSQSGSLTKLGNTKRGRTRRGTKQFLLYVYIFLIGDGLP